MFWVWLVGAFLLVLSVGALAWSRRLRVQSGLPQGRVVESDTDSGRRAAPITSARYGLTGAPDYVVKTPRGLVPVEVKPLRTETEPRKSHLLQVLAYCLLLEEREGKRPPYGLLKYSTETFRVDYNNDTRRHIIEVIEEMRLAAKEVEVHRSHDVPGKCRACAYRSICEEALV